MSLYRHNGKLIESEECSKCGKPIHGACTLHYPLCGDCIGGRSKFEDAIHALIDAAQNKEAHKGE